jgi:alpha-maltose-1-phosphate synthase
MSDLQKKPMRIVINSISFCEYIIQQANALAGLGHAVLLVVPIPLIENTVGTDIGVLLHPSVNYYTYEVVGKWRYGFYRNLFNAVSNFSPDVLHIHDNGEVETLALVLRYWRIPLVLTIHDVTTHPGIDSRIRTRRKLVKRLLKRRAVAIHLHGEALRVKFTAIYPALSGKSIIIPHGALSLFRHWENCHIEREPLTCLFFGRMEKYRGLDNLLLTGRILKDTIPGIRILVAGRGSELDKYKSEMEATGVFEIHDSFIPNKDVHKFFRRASLLLLPYHEASQSGVVLMGLTFGVPIVATAVGSIPEIIVDGLHGRVVPEGDINCIANAIRELLYDEHRLAQMGSACQQLADSLSFERLAVDFNSMYVHAISAKE